MNNKAYALITDIGQDWDDAGMLDKAIDMGLQNVYVITVSGDTKLRAKIAERHITSKVGKVVHDGNILTFQRGDNLFEWHFYAARPTESAKMEISYREGVDSPMEALPWPPTPGMAFNNLEGLLNWAALIAGPPVGCDLSELPSYGSLNSIVFVGNNPTGLAKGRGINGGGSLTVEDMYEIGDHLQKIGDDSDVEITYLHPNLTRSIYATTRDLNTMGEMTANTLLDFTAKFYLGERPGHLSVDLQERIATVNLKGVSDLVHSVNPDFHPNVSVFMPRAREYAKKFPTLSDNVLFFTNTALIYGYADYILSYNRESTRVALSTFLSSNPGGSNCVTLLPKYDVTGLLALITIHECGMVKECFRELDVESPRLVLTREILRNFPDVEECENCRYHSNPSNVYYDAGEGWSMETTSVMFPCMNHATLYGYSYGYIDGKLEKRES